MPYLFHIDLFELILKGMLIGIIASAPMGPVGILCIQRTINKGRWYGLVTGIGAACSDIIYALITGLGMSFAMNLITNPSNKFWLQIVGSTVLLFFGVYCFRSKPKRHLSHANKGKGTYWHNGITAFLITFSNPLIIFLFMAAYAQLAFAIPHRPLEMLLAFMSIFGGALLWWFALTWLIDKVRGRFNASSLVLINKIIGSIVMVCSIVVLIGTIFNLYSFH